MLYQIKQMGRKIRDERLACKCFQESLFSIAILTIGILLHSKALGENVSILLSRNDTLEQKRFISIPGPNPILQPGQEGTWDCVDIETGDAFKDFGKYYLYYHGTSPLREEGSAGYRIGVARSDHPLGPFQRHGDKPILDLGEKGNWDDFHVACPMILKEGVDKYYMWYSGYGHQQGVWSIGLATAVHPLGPWKKYESNPVMKDFGYVGAVVKVEGKYYMYSEHPIGSTGDDYAPLSVAVADRPEGPWIPWSGNPVMRQGEWGEWDDGGISEAEVVYHSGLFHLFYGGAKLHTNRRQTRESIGYAYSVDGFHFKKYGRNPVVNIETNPNIASMSEVHAIFELPFIYLYHTIRYKTPLTVKGLFRPLGDEDIGVQVLATQSPFTLDIPFLRRVSLSPQEQTSFDDTAPLNLSNITHLALTVECAYGKKATLPLRIHVRSSHDGYEYDTADLFVFDHGLEPNKMVRKTFDLKTSARFIKVVAENPDANENIRGLKITATLGN